MRVIESRLSLLRRPGKVADAGIGTMGASLEGLDEM